MSCKYCVNASPLFRCECGADSLLCSNHIFNHLENDLRHCFRNVDDGSALVLNSQKANLSARVEYIKQQSELIKEEVKIKVKEFKKTLKNSAKLLIRNLEFIIKQGDELLESLHSCTSIKKTHLNPLERFLCTMEKYDMLDDLVGPKAVFPSSDLKFKLTFPTFLHELYNYSSFTVGFKDNKIVSIPKIPNMHHELFNSSSRVLFTNYSQILVTGLSQNCSCVKFDLAIRTIVQYPQLNTPRRWHAMTWLDGFPCVLGGKLENKDLDSVEILKGSNWLEVKKMNVPRSSFSAINYVGKVWAVGGIDNENMNSVEKYDGGEWVLLGIRSSLLCSSVGLVGVGPYLMIFGGFRMSENSKLSLVDVLEEKLIEVFEFNQEFYFNLNSITIRVDRVCGFDTNFSLKEIMKAEIYP